MLKKLLKYLSSVRFTIVLICLLALTFMIGLWVPQVSLVKVMYLQWKSNSPALVSFLDALWLTSIYTSPITVTLWVLFFLNLSLVMWQRVPLVRSRTSLSTTKIVNPTTAGGYSFRNSYPVPEGIDNDAVIGFLHKNGYAVVGNGDGFYGVKNRLSPIASLLFHLSFFLILLGGLVTIYTTFIGYLDLAQGESFQGELGRYNARPIPLLPKVGTIPKASFTVKSIVPHVVKNTPTGIDVELVDGAGRAHTAGINIPYIVDNTSFVFKHLGVAPLFVVKDPSGKEIDGAYSKLDVMLGRQDSFSLAGFVFRANFYPDYTLEGGVASTRTQEFKNPVFAIEVERDGKKIAKGTVPKNGAMTFAGYRLEMKEMPFWVRFYVIKERGISILYTGFAIASLALIWKLLLYRREMVGAIREEGGRRLLVVACRAEYYKSLAEDEFIKLFNKFTNNSTGE